MTKISVKELKEVSMKVAEPRPEETKSIPVAPQTIGDVLRLRICDLSKHWRLWGCMGFAVVVTMAFIKPLYSLAVHSAISDLNSYILLVPFISAYLIYIRGKRLPGEYFSSPGFAMVPLAVGLAALAVPWSVRVRGLSLSHNDFLTLISLAFVCFLVAGGFFFLGRKWMAAAAFPVAFLIFIVPLPDCAVTGWRRRPSLPRPMLRTCFSSSPAHPCCGMELCSIFPGLSSKSRRNAAASARVGRS